MSPFQKKKKHISFRKYRELCDYNTLGHDFMTITLKAFRSSTIFHVFSFLYYKLNIVSSVIKVYGGNFSSDTSYEQV